jgi:hypothetical protein
MNTTKPSAGRVANIAKDVLLSRLRSWPRLSCLQLRIFDRCWDWGWAVWLDDWEDEREKTSEQCLNVY